MSYAKLQKVVVTLLLSAGAGTGWLVNQAAGAEGNDLEQKSKDKAHLEAQVRGKRSPDGKYVVYSEVMNNALEVYRAKVDGTDVRRLTDHIAVDTEPDWLPDGRIVFLSDRTAALYGQGCYQLHAMDADGRNVTQLTNVKEGWVNRLTVGPEGGVLYLTRTRRRGKHYFYDVFWLKNGKHRKLASDLLTPEAALSPDGKTVAVGGGEPGHIVLCSTDEKGAKTSVNVAKKYPAFKDCNATCLRWRADSQKVAFRALGSSPYREPHGQYLTSHDGELEEVNLKELPEWMRDRLAAPAEQTISRRSMVQTLE